MSDGTEQAGLVERTTTTYDGYSAVKATDKVARDSVDGKVLVEPDRTGARQAELRQTADVNAQTQSADKVGFIQRTANKIQNWRDRVETAINNRTVKRHEGAEKAQALHALDLKSQRDATPWFRGIKRHNLKHQIRAAAANSELSGIKADVHAGRVAPREVRAQVTGGAKK